MIVKETIYIKNIYYMLSYAFNVLNEREYKKIEAESFDNAADLLSQILIIGVSKQIKQGLVKDYIEVTETTSSIRGKINITESINSQSFIKRQLNCTYDEFSQNCYLNRILKSTMSLLIKADIMRIVCNHNDRTDRTYVLQPLPRPREILLIEAGMLPILFARLILAIQLRPDYGDIRIIPR